MTREDDVGQTMLGVFGQSEIEWTRSVRTTLGLRADVYQFSVTSNNPLNSGGGRDALVSPKLGAIFGPWRGTEFYVNAGMGFHSNDARGATIAVDPESGESVARYAAGAREGRRMAFGPSAFAVCNRQSRSGTSGSIRAAVRRGRRDD